MTDIPIMFSAPMVLALLAGRKTMTRRLAWRPAKVNRRVEHGSLSKLMRESIWQRVKPGDRLWVRESGIVQFADVTRIKIGYAADGVTSDWIEFPERLAFEPEIGHGVPNGVYREASRLTLVVTATKIEPLQRISKADVIAEGITERNGASIADVAAGWHEPFSALWNNLHGARSWDANPDVVAMSFAVHRRNIDALKQAA